MDNVVNDKDDIEQAKEVHVQVTLPFGAVRLTELVLTFVKDVDDNNVFSIMIIIMIIMARIIMIRFSSFWRRS